MNRISSMKNQRGAVLVIGLMVMLAASIVVTAGMRGTNIQERMAGNHNNKAVSLMAAEAGASRFWQWLNTASVDPSSNDWQALIPANTLGTNNVGPNGYYWIDPNDVEFDSATGIMNVIVQGLARSGNAVLAETRLNVEYIIATGMSNSHPAFFTGLLADQNIQINGNANLTGSAHANGNFNVTGGNSHLHNRSMVDENGDTITINSTVSASGTASMSNTTSDDNRFSNAATVEVPSASTYISEYIADNPTGYTTGCNIGGFDHFGAVFYCDGNATTSGDFRNVTILATGNVTHNGAAQLGGNALTVMIVAGGNITINGSNDTYGVFWADGNVTQNGSSILGGSVVAGGTITRNGVFNYQQHDNFGNLNLPPGNATSFTSIGGWSEHYP